MSEGDTPSSSVPAVAQAGDGVFLGSGWYSVEHYKDETFQWSRNDGEITACVNANKRTLVVKIEPGPAIGPASMQLSIRGNRGDRTDVTVKGRQSVTVPLGNNVAAETFLFHARTLGLRLPSPSTDKRILSFRVFDAAVGSSIKDCTPDITRDGTLAVGKNWYSLETVKQETFRWIKNDAQIIVPAAQSRPFTIEMDVEPGPGLAHSPLVVTVHGSNGRVLATSQPLRGRDYVTFSLPAQLAGARLTLTTRSKNAPIPNDPRTLNFRLFDLKIRPS
jgi:hypothetical protein